MCNFEVQIYRTPVPEGVKHSGLNITVRCLIFAVNLIQNWDKH